jgi:hypothetical protein
MTIEVTVKELGFVCNALNEVSNGIDLPEFETRLGVTRQEADELLMKLNNIARVARQTQEDAK